MQVWTVSELISVINQTLDYAYASVVVEGEVSAFKVSKDKYVFFDLKDNEGSLNCFMMLYQLKMALEDGLRVRVVAQPRLTAWGKFSLTVRDVTPVGEGSIKRAFELLKARLEAEGLFDVDRKRRLPALPQRIGLIASVESAGYADFIKIVNQRWKGLTIDVANVQVQGVGAGEQIVRAIDYFNQQADLVEALVIIRGGGSADDLAVFNEEPLVRAVAGSRIPTLVGVGHEVDTCLCDLAADVRAATPSNAAQILVPERTELVGNVRHQQRHMALRLDARLDEVHRDLVSASRHMLVRLEHMIAGSSQAVQSAERLLRQLDPSVVLRRGYALVRTDKGQLVRGRAIGLKVGDELTVTIAHAIIKTGVKDVKRQKVT